MWTLTLGQDCAKLAKSVLKLEYPTETPVATAATIWESEADTWTAYVAITTADPGSLLCDSTNVAWQRLHMVGKKRVLVKTLMNQKWLSDETKGDLGMLSLFYSVHLW